MNKIYVKPRAKINLTLNILDKRPDGYHNLESVFQKISLYDEMYIEKTNSNKIDLTCNIQSLQSHENIIYKAYALLKQKHNYITGIKITLLKHIPLCSGLGGGSTDCSSFLTSMNKLFNLNYSLEELIDIGKSLGADVPPCLYNKAIFAEGIGEIISEINTNMKYYIVLVKPKCSFNTITMYKKIDLKSDLNQEYNSKNIVTALESNNFDLLSNNLYNVFEEVLDFDSEVFKIKELLIRYGASNSLMTGSGSVVFGVFNDKEASKTAYHNLKHLYETYWCHTTNNI